MSKDYEEIEDQDISTISLSDSKSADQNTKGKWIDNKDNEIEEVFGFNENAELVNARAAMIGFLMLILTELAFGGEPVTLAIFGIN